MKKRILAFIFAAVLLFSLFSCGQSEDGEGGYTEGEVVVLNVYNWGEYISDGFDGSMDTNAEFENYFNEYLSEKYGGITVSVNYTTYATNEDMFAKLSSGSGGSYDIVVPSDYMIEKMIAADMLEPFGADSLENYVNILDDFKGMYYDPENLYSVPYTYGMLGVIYNSALVDEEDVADESWGLLWNEKYRGKILQFNNPRDAFGSAMYYLGLDVNSTDKAVWDAALNKLVEQKDLLQGYVNDEIFNKMTTASAAIAPYFAGDFITMADQNEDLAFYYPNEGTNYFVDAMCILKTSKNKEIAKEYINFMLTEEPAVANSIYVGYSSPNRLVRESEEYFDEMGEEAYEILYGADPEVINEEYNALYGTACYKSFTPEIQSYVNSLWESLKTENATETWVHVTCILIVGTVLCSAIYSIYIKKKRSKNYRTRDRLAAAAKKNK